MSPLLALPSLCGALLSLAVSVALFRTRPGPAWRYGTAAGLSVAWWCAGQTAWFLVDNLAMRIPVAMVQYVGITTAPALWLLTALAYVGQRDWLRPTRRFLFFVIPGLTMIAAFTNDRHHLLWKDFVITPTQVRISYGPLFTVHAAYSYSVAAIGSLIMAARFAASPHYRPQFLFVLLGPGIVLVTNLLYLVAGSRIPLDLTPAAFAVSLVGFAWALAKHHFLQLLPMARGIAFEGMRDAFLVLDGSGRIVDINPATEFLLDRSPSSLLGSRLEEAIPSLDLAAISSGRPVEVKTSSGKTLEGRQSSLSLGGAGEATVVMLRDVTTERAAQEQLLQAQAKLQAANLELERLALTDPLTGLANRRSLLARLGEETARAKRRGRPLSFLMLDVDHFKRVNDTYGHAAGDRVLESIGRSLLEMVRPGDVPARLGGEEFGILLPETSGDEACSLARRIAAALRAIRHGIREGEEIGVTLSFGIATRRAEDETGAEMMERADAALYRTKETGRDGISRATAEGIERI